jgi:hypothetical protein
MKPLPNLDDGAAMAARGRRSALMSARNDAAEELRNVCVAIQSVDLHAEREVTLLCGRGRMALDQLEQIARLANV